MTWYNAIVTAGALAGAILSIKALIAPLIKKVDSVLAEIAEARKENKENAEKIDRLKEYSDEHYLELLKHTIMNPEIPTKERIIAGEKYLERGGNGEVKAYFEKFVAEHTI